MPYHYIGDLLLFRMTYCSLSSWPAWRKSCRKRDGRFPKQKMKDNLGRYNKITIGWISYSALTMWQIFTSSQMCTTRAHCELEQQIACKTGLIFSRFSGERKQGWNGQVWRTRQARRGRVWCSSLASRLPSLADNIQLRLKEKFASFQLTKFACFSTFLDCLFVFPRIAILLKRFSFSYILYDPRTVTIIFAGYK